MAEFELSGLLIPAWVHLTIEQLMELVNSAQLSLKLVLFFVVSLYCVCVLVVYIFNKCIEVLLI